MKTEHSLLCKGAYGVINESTVACVNDAGPRETYQLSIMDIPVATS